MLKFLIFLVLAVVVSPEKELDYEGAQLLRLKVSTPCQVKAATSIDKLNLDGVDYWLEPNLRRPVDLYVPQTSLAVVKRYLKEKNIGYQVSIPDIGKLISKQRKQNKQNKNMDWDNYHRYDTIMTFLDRIATEHPTLVTLQQYGVSSEGRPLKVIKLGTNSICGQTKPAFFFDGGMHAREWLSPAVLTWFVRELAENADSYMDILNGVDIYITPLANPDGYEFTHTHQRLWRKTRSNHSSPLGCFGVDPFRNFDYKWGDPKTNSDKCSDTYKGPAPYSEPEIRSMKNFIELKRDEGVKWVAYFAVHTYSQLWLVPWGWTNSHPQTYDELVDFGRVGVTALKSVHGTSFEVGSITEFMSPSWTGSCDWAYGSGIFRYSQAVELRDTGRYGFLMPSDQIVPAAQETFAAIAPVARFVIRNP